MNPRRYVYHHPSPDSVPVVVSAFEEAHASLALFDVVRDPASWRLASIDPDGHRPDAERHARAYRRALQDYQDDKDRREANPGVPAWFAEEYK